MSDDFECPHCDRLIDIGNHPDYLTDMGPSCRFNFECDCGAAFDVFVEFDPVFYVEDDTLVRPTPPPQESANPSPPHAEQLQGASAPLAPTTGQADE